MAIYLIEGKIGSGKTYYAVYSMLADFFQWSKYLMRYVMARNVLIISNITGLKFPHVDLLSEIETLGVKVVFSAEYLEGLRLKYGVQNIVILIDELQLILDRKFYDKEIFGFFQLSRKQGLDIYIMTQDLKTIPREIQVLPELFYHAHPRTAGGGGRFRYTVASTATGASHSFQLIPIKQEVFDVYKSQDYEEVKPIKQAYKKYAFALVIMILIVVGLFYKIMYNFKHPNIKSASVGVQKSAEVRSKGDAATNAGGVLNVIESKLSDSTLANLYKIPIAYFQTVRGYCSSDDLKTSVDIQGASFNSSVYTCGGFSYSFSSGQYLGRRKLDIVKPLDSDEVMVSNSASAKEVL